MDNLTYVKDSRNGREAAVINGEARFQLGGIGVVYRSDLEDGAWTSYSPIPMSFSFKSEFYEHMITVAQHAAQTGNVSNMISGLRTVFGDGVAMCVGIDGERDRVGYQLSPEMNERIPEAGRNPDGWYPIADGETALVAAFIPECFSDDVVETARDAVMRDFPDLAASFDTATGMRR
ncbi:hypothetical protein G6L37_03235 [Agrobacterium rubi]|nr:hypothetical protein [Agrobacterium rubi]NTF24389.1 hypothetical protein [Agrobacterium rubi]